MRHRYLLFPIPCLLVACATPLRPSGGPADTTPPEIVDSRPAAGAVRVRDALVVLTFSERVEEASVRRALSVTPSGAAPPDVRVRGREVHIDLGDSLRSDITYVLTLGTELRDLRGVAVPAPITLAFATGDRIDEGRIAGVVRDPETGAAAAGLSILAYRVQGDSADRPNPVVDAADYRSQSATDGSFALGYVRPGRYFVVALRDRNRDGLAGPDEAFAVPPSPVVAAADTGAVASVVLFIAAVDTTGPALRSARAVDSRTVAARFDEPVTVVDSALGAFALEDSASASSVPVEGAWVAGDSREVLLATGRLGRRAYRLRLAPAGPVADSAGNTARAAVASFDGPSADESPAARFARFVPQARVASDSAFVLLPGERPGARFSRPVQATADATRVSVLDDSGSAVAFQLQSADAVTVLIVTSAQDFRVQVADSTNTRRFRVATDDELGGVVGRVVAAAAGAVRIDVSLQGGARPVERSAVAEEDGTFAITGLPAGSYRLRVHVDSDDDGRWDAGSLFPYAPPESIGWLPGPIRVRARWETDLGEIRLAGGIATAEGLEADEQQEQ